MTEEEAYQFLAKIQVMCTKVGAYCDVLTKCKPHLDYAKVEISIKVNPK